MENQEFKINHFMIIVFLSVIGGTIFIKYFALNHLPKIDGELTNLGLIGIFLSELIATTLLPLPSPLIVSSLAVLTNNYLLAGLLAVIGSVSGSSINFLIGRVLKKIFYWKKFHKWNSYEEFNKFWKVHGAPLLLINGVFPLSFFDLLTVLAGVSSMKYQSFLTTVATSKTLMYLIIIGLLVA